MEKKSFYKRRQKLLREGVWKKLDDDKSSVVELNFAGEEIWLEKKRKQLEEEETYNKKQKITDCELTECDCMYSLFSYKTIVIIEGKSQTKTVRGNRVQVILHQVHTQEKRNSVQMILHQV